MPTKTRKKDTNTMKATVKYIGEDGKETSKEKAVGRIVSVYDNDGNFIEERFGEFRVQLEDDTKHKN